MSQQVSESVFIAAVTVVPHFLIQSALAVRYSAMPEMFAPLVHSARHELVITTPYFVPDESMQAALCASANRSVATTMVFPARNDSWTVAAISRSYCRKLLGGRYDFRDPMVT